MRYVKLRDLIPLHTEKVVGTNRSLMRLTDRELLNAVERPTRNEPLMVNVKTGKLANGNSRYYELVRRARNPSSRITLDTLVPVVDYVPDDSAFLD